MPHVPEVGGRAAWSATAISERARELRSSTRGSSCPTASRDGGLLIDGDRIEAMLSPRRRRLTTRRSSTRGGRYLGPGLIDIHVHGGGGFDLMTDDPEQVRGYARWVGARGVTSFLVSTSGRDHATIVRRLRALAPASSAQSSPAPRARSGSISKARTSIPCARARSRRAGCARRASTSTTSCSRRRAATIAQMTLAPELPGADALIDAVVASGAVAAIGHTDATYEQAMHADRARRHARHALLQRDAAVRASRPRRARRGHDVRRGHGGADRRRRARRLRGRARAASARRATSTSC